MNRLSFGSQGAEVKRLQRALKERGFSPGAIDGDFGPATEQAVLGFQRSTAGALLTDGVAGPRTLAALGLVDSDALPDATAAMSIGVASRMCPDAQIDDIKTNLPAVLKSLDSRGLGDRVMVLMAVSTIRAETASFLPVSEGRSKFNTSPGGHPFDLYDRRGDLGNRGAPDGERYRGRGFVQLTGRFNYRRYGKRLQVDLEARPELANNADLAADLLSVFLGDRELNIKDALIHQNFQAARRLVNGGSHGLDAFTAAYRTGDALLP
ncbi:MAG TPA: peptidoglycan-binding protein [Burkholderiaceae bacterium]|nr:peptidoglycan-binding protein [Burkholderiaceae bacterium]